ncbi:hypothetical protein F951_03121 [Acinetobacter soli CIP 110264]|uniref:hypothetical protein n=1 Tax=Acinetobacter soli TaxID=487316 RepID=UPI0002CFA114|nr:hypothetical protein [Acinetobacter soli]ENV55937.1 hypothetical protein F951_03121 [Acinetobacter soli CIP 110264]
MKNLMSFFYSLILISMIAFPKSGFAIGSTPINSITLLIILLFPILLLSYLNNINYKNFLNYSDIYFIMLLPFYFVFFTITLSNGFEELSSYLGFIFSLIVSPLFFLFLFKFIDNKTIIKNKNIIIYCIRFVSIYGLILFSYKFLTNSFFEIPGLTTTFGAAVELEEKMNDRGGIFKLFSTYNNGNLYGLSVGMLFPLYTFLEKNKIFIIIVFLSLILTFSRTIWFILSIYFIYHAIFMSKFNPIKIIIGVLSLLLFGIIINLTLSFLGYNSNFLFDTSLGGRADSLKELSFELYSTKPFINTSEIPYLTILYSLGVIGIPLFLMYFSNIIINFKLLLSSKNSIRKSATLGSILYFFACFSDAAIIYIPVFIIFMFVTFLSLKPEK